MIGRIIRIISNLYSVDVEGKIYECRARGKFRNMELTPLVGDIVEISNENYILDIKERKNELTRPNIANVDGAIIVTSLTRPEFSPFLLDKMLTNVLLKNVDPIIVLTKADLLTEDKLVELKLYIDYYNKIGIPCILNTELDKFNKLIDGKTLVITGQTGVGKSTLLNKLDCNLNLETNDISDALGRGKHTTRHTELYKYKNSYLADTPGFSSLDINAELKENIRFTFKEFKNEECKFNDCKHINEAGCKILEDLKNKEILQSRYDSYVKMINN